MYFLGVDSGGTKTIFILCDDKGNILARHKSGSGGFLTKGKEGIRILLMEGVREICSIAGIEREEITSAGLGFPGYGEKSGSKADIKQVCEEVIGKGKTHCESDSYLGWAGSLGMKPGINIVSGTGSICFGMNGKGRTARSGGWGAYCDEGSCTWIGGKLTAAFAKESDGRRPRTILYEMYREHFHIKNDVEFIHTWNREIAAKGSEMAKLQYLLRQIYEAGSETAEEIYQSAAEELALSAWAAAQKLGMQQGYRVSYSGGLFKSGDCIIHPLQRCVEKRGGRLFTPRFPPEVGALLFAMHGVLPDKDFQEFKIL